MRQRNPHIPSDEVTDARLEEFIKSNQFKDLLDILGIHVMIELRKYPLGVFEALPSNIQELIREKMEEAGI